MNECSTIDKQILGKNIHGKGLILTDTKITTKRQLK